MRFAILLVLTLPLCAESLRDLADVRQVRIGTAVAPSHLNEAAYAATLAREFNQVEPENAMKFGPIHPTRDGYNFAPADAVVEFGMAHKMAIRGHTLVWHLQNAAWVSGSPDEVAGILQEHIKTVAGRYAGKVYAWDVVNEAVETDGSLRKSKWSVIPDYVEKAFRWTRAADPKALLFYNDYGAESMNKKSDAIYQMARDFKARGVPIDGVGLQMHLSAKAPDIAGMRANLKRLTDLGLQVQITELDVKLPVEGGAVVGAGALADQAKVYREIFGLCLENPRCTAIQLWGFTDRYSWIPGSSKGFGAALPLDADYRPKPAYEAIVEAFKAAH